MPAYNQRKCKGIQIELIIKNLMKIFNINFIKKNTKKSTEFNQSKEYDPYGEIGKLVKEARIQNGFSIKELSDISKIPESSINSIEDNIKNLRPRDPFIRSILFLSLIHI